jgi:probable rRNA maturation factor
MPALIHLYDHQSALRVDLNEIATLANQALPLCLATARSGASVLHMLEEIEISVVGDERIAAVHAEFLDDPSATDVITFDHGEILISADTAAANAADHGESVDREILRYVIHGLLHLAGWNDEDTGEHAEMLGHQERILAQVTKPPD